MAKKGAFGVLKIGTPTTPAIVSEIRSWRVNQEAGEIDTTVMGTGKASMIPAAVSETLEGDLFFEYSDVQHAYMLANVGSETLIELELYPTGEDPASGNYQWSASGYLMSFTLEAAADGAVEANGFRFSTDSTGGTWAPVA